MPAISSIGDRMCDVLILGARSWIGFRLAEAFRVAYPTWNVVGTSTSVTAGPQSSDRLPQFLVNAVTPSDNHALVHELHPRIVFNLLRGEDEQGLDIHRRVVGACVELGIRYVYASSALALDGYSSHTILTEDLPSQSISPYGRFKGVCEGILGSSYASSDWLILRFASIQGWSPWKPSRNEAFLRKLADRNSIIVDVGITQNRLLDTVFAAAVVDITVNESCQGIYHLGADDASEELNYLRSVAQAFGFDDSLVHAGNSRDLNLRLSCSRLHQATDNRWRRTEAETLNGLLVEPSLQVYQQGPPTTHINSSKHRDKFY